MRVGLLSYALVALIFAQMLAASDEEVQTVFEKYRTAIPNADAALHAY